MTSRNPVPSAELQFESEGTSELEEKEFYILQASPASQVLLWEFHVHQGFRPEAWVSQVTLAALSPRTVTPPSHLHADHHFAQLSLPVRTTRASSCLGESSLPSGLPSPLPPSPAPLFPTQQPGRAYQAIVIIPENGAHCAALTPCQALFEARYTHSRHVRMVPPLASLTDVETEAPRDEVSAKFTEPGGDVSGITHPTTSLSCQNPSQAPTALTGQALHWGPQAPLCPSAPATLAFLPPGPGTWPPPCLLPVHY